VAVPEPKNRSGSSLPRAPPPSPNRPRLFARSGLVNQDADGPFWSIAPQGASQHELAGRTCVGCGLAEIQLGSMYLVSSGSLSLWGRGVLVCLPRRWRWRAVGQAAAAVGQIRLPAPMKEGAGPASVCTQGQDAIVTLEQQHRHPPPLHQITQQQRHEIAKCRIVCAIRVPRRVAET